MTGIAAGQVDNVCTRTVAHDLCIGCGVCAGGCPTHNQCLGWNAHGLYIPQDQGVCRHNCRVCLQVCPFQPHIDNEDTLTQARFSGEAGICHSPVTGYHRSSWVGAVTDEEHRRDSASGGLASWLLARLLDDGVVDRVACVIPGGDPHRLFTYTMCETSADVRSARGSAYYPVELSQVLRSIRRQEARYAIIGLPCMLKGVRLAMAQMPWLRERVKILVGLVCGQIKSRGFTEMLLHSSSDTTEEITRVKFREKVPGHPPTEFYFSAGAGPVIPFSHSHYGGAWVSGQFTPRVCQFCDDIFAETADITFMDAWLPPYSHETRGTNLVLVRAAQVERVLEAGLAKGETAIQPITLDEIIASQRGVVKRKRDQLSLRLWMANRRRQTCHPTRVAPRRPTLLQRLHIDALEAVRRTSHDALCRQRDCSTTDFSTYHAELAPLLRRMQRIEALANLCTGRWWRAVFVRGWQRCISHLSR
ncbi:MAG: Coenzyme F420 hydrogenase/dehydrogenase, beta subunit C-terminal domain [Armatimonadota bacterium]